MQLLISCLPALAYLLAAAVLLGGCGTAQPDQAPCPDMPAELTEVDYTASAPPELAELAQCAANRWGAAAGIRIDIVPDQDADIEILSEDPPGSRTGSFGGYQGRGRIKIAPRLSEETTGQLLAHELGHCLAGSAKHSDDGVIKSGGLQGARISSVDLEMVCSGADCRWFSPER